MIEQTSNSQVSSVLLYHIHTERTVTHLFIISFAADNANTPNVAGKVGQQGYRSGSIVSQQDIILYNFRIICCVPCINFLHVS
jgi:hypothetical protein